MSRTRAIVVLATVTGIGVGCSFGALEGFSSGSLPLPEPATIEGGIAADAAADSGPGDSGTTAFSCGAHPNALVCATFDGDPFDLGFDRSASTGGRVGMSTTSFMTAPRALTASLDARSTSQQPNAFLQRGVAALATLRAFTLSWDVLVATSAKQEAVDIGGISRTGTPYWALHIRYRRDFNERIELFEYGNAIATLPEIVQFSPLSRGLAPGRFTRLELRLAISPGASTATVVVDGVLASEAIPIAFDRYPGLPFVMTGITGSDGSGGAIDAFVDDLLAEPR